MTDYIGDELPPKVIRVTKGTDRKFSVRRKDTNGNPMDWDATVTISIDINPTAPTLIAAVVTNEIAEINIQSTVANQVKDMDSPTPTTWQMFMSEAGTPTLETPLMVGVFQRQDGKIA